jgi:hopanoid biosynthesis associated protein HpnK
MKELIINADDFGLSRSVNLAVLKGWQEGILTSASLMVGGSASADAVAIAREHSGLQVGLHLTLVQGQGVQSYEKFPSIVDRNRNFSSDPVHAGLRYFFVKPLRKQLYREIEAQIVAFQNTGLQLSHLDGHLNIHLHPVVFDILEELMPKHGISSFRLTRESLVDNLAIDRRRYAGKMLESYIFRKLAHRARPSLDHWGIMYADEVKGLFSSGRITEPFLMQLLDKIGDGVTEIYCHPAVCPDEEMMKLMPDYQHERELEALTSPRVKEQIRLQGIRLRNYRGEEKANV